MAYINWSDRYSVSNAHLDGQQQELFRIVNTLHEAILERCSRDRKYIQDSQPERA